MKVLKTNVLTEIKILTYLFFIAAMAEIIAEYFEIQFFIYLFKAMLIPILIWIYCKSSKIKNQIYLAALVFGFIANLLFIAKDYNSIFAASIFYGFYRLLVLYVVLKTMEVKKYFQVFLGSIPFIFVFLYVTSLTINQLGNTLYLYVWHSVMIIFLSGFALSNYVIESNKTNYWLLISSLLFILTQFILLLKIFYLSVPIFQPMAMLLYCFAQFALYKFMILSENDLDNNTLTA